MASFSISSRAPAAAARRELGNIESICLTILAGFCVDYIVHLAHCYMESPDVSTCAPAASPITVTPRLAHRCACARPLAAAHGCYGGGARLSAG